MNRRNYALSAAAFGIALLIHCVALWQPARQVRLHQQHLLRSVENRDWPRFESFIDDHYSDRWGHDKSFVTKESREVFRQFIWVTVQQREDVISMTPGLGAESARLVIAGAGGPLGEAVKQRVNGLAGPCEFRWKKAGWKPWEWKLVEFDQAELEIPDGLW